ncbi:MAG: hypothetical protein JOZ10_00235 [Acidobacteria bacterium]|nr:hypothetical protein [Acidobacteriota bacterium]MBV9147866.1 hypothetical protein [Acidobacteriota bacterium]MBV9434573.1 hypothetical protein [Acidobacteriota bacterium]
MEKSRGTMSAYRMFSVSELGVSTADPHVDQIIKEFLAIGEAVAARWIQMPKGILLLQMAPENPNSGAIYVYDRMRHNFYMLGFEGAEDTITLQQFADLLVEYDLLRYAEQPALLDDQWPKRKTA